MRHKFTAYHKITLQFLTIFMMLLNMKSFSQVNHIKGVVKDMRSGEPLAFVSVATDVASAAAITDIEGRFHIQSDAPFSELKLSYVGYERKKVEIGGRTFVEVFLEAGGVSLKTAVIVAGENPAHRIIREAVRQRERHNPSRIPAYSCELYNKLVLTGIPDTISAPLIKADELASKQRADSLFERQHLFMMESLTDRRSKSGKVNEEVLGSRVSGLKDASFLLLMMQLQPFSFYEDFFSISAISYLNPISKNSEERYFFALEDTLFSGTDTTYIISFKPKANKVFDALKGLLYISAPDYAIQNVIAEPAKQESTHIKVQQQYRRNNGLWFPEQLNTNIVFTGIKLPGYHIIGTGLNYVRNVDFNPDFSKVRFSEIEMDVNPKASRRDSVFWQEVRIEDLSPQEQETFRMLDSISKAQRFDTKLRAMEGLFNGAIPVWLLEIDIDRIASFNDYEGFRLGAGVATNNRLSRTFKFGGYYGYGFKDRASKYGGFAQALINQRREMRFEIRYENDLREAGNQGIEGFRRLIGNERVRDLYVRLFDFTETYEANITWRWMKYIRTRLFAKHALATPMYDYQFRPSNLFEPVTLNNYQFQEAGISIRYAPKEKFFRNNHLLLSLGSTHPVIWFQTAAGSMLIDGRSYNYNKTAFKFEYTKPWRRLGNTTLQFDAGAVFGEVPFGMLINPLGNLSNKNRINVASRNVFETMQINEFILDRYLALFINQRIGNFIKIKKFAPELAFIHHSGFGWLQKPEIHQGLLVQGMEHGFHESGIAINKIIGSAFASYGIAFFYRYGAYQLPELKDNFSIKLTFGLGL